MDYDLDLLKAIIVQMGADSKGHFYAVLEILEALHVSSIGSEGTDAASRVYEALKAVYVGEVEW